MQFWSTNKKNFILNAIRYVHKPNPNARKEKNMDTEDLTRQIIQSVKDRNEGAFLFTKTCDSIKLFERGKTWDVVEFAIEIWSGNTGAPVYAVNNVNFQSDLLLHDNSEMTFLFCKEQPDASNGFVLFDKVGCQISSFLSTKASVFFAFKTNSGKIPVLFGTFTEREDGTMDTNFILSDDPAFVKFARETFQLSWETRRTENE